MRLQLSTMLIQALVNGAVGIAAFVLVERGPEMVAARQLARARRRFAEGTDP